jgi:vanillate O-demethylase monooxygenase subunit
MFAQNVWYVACDKEDIVADKPLALKIAGENIVFYRDSKGQIVAMADLCPHRLAPLSLGRVEGDEIRCMYHGITFDSDGKCTHVPGQDVVPDNFCTKKYSVHESYEWVFVWIGDQDKADEALLPDLTFHNPELFNVRKGSIDFDADYELFNDNTCDLSHVSYVHAETFAKHGEHSWSDKPVTTLKERSVCVDRWMTNQPSPAAPDAKVDLCSRFEHFLPGVFVMDFQVHPSGTAEQLDRGAPTSDMSPMHHSGTIQTMRPITETTSKFYFSIVSPKWVPDEVLDADFEFGKLGFKEDKTMIEQQQKMILENPDEPLRATVHDKAGLYIRKLIRKTIKQAEVSA